MDRPARPRPSSSRPMRRSAEVRTGTVECPRCDRSMARIIGRSEVVPVVYLRCDGCHTTSIVRD